MKWTSVALGLALGACVSTPKPIAPGDWPSLTLTATSGAVESYPRDLAAAPFTVFVFFSKDCLCFGAHEPRLRALVDKFSPRGVRFVFVDPEIGRTMDEDAHEVQARKLPAPILLDPGAKLATLLGAVYATYSVVVDSAGQIRYRGGIDADKSHLRADATPFLADALDDLTAGRPPRRPEGKTLGCALQMW